MSTTACERLSSPDCVAHTDRWIPLCCSAQSYFTEGLEAFNQEKYNLAWMKFTEAKKAGGLALIPTVPVHVHSMRGVAYDHLDVMLEAAKQASSLMYGLHR